MAHSSTKHNKIQRRKNFWGYLFIAPNFIGFVVFMLLPILMSLYYSFTDYDVITEANFVGFENYIKLFQDDQFITALLNTLWYCVLTVPAGVILALLLAVLFNRQIPGIGAFRTLTFIPVITSMVAVSLIWSMLYEDNGGLLNTLLGYVGLPPVHWLTDTNMAMISIAIMSIWKGLGYNMTIFLAGLQGVPHDLYEAATIDGANSVQKFFKITVPMIGPTTYFVPGQRDQDRCDVPLPVRLPVLQNGLCVRRGVCAVHSGVYCFAHSKPQFQELGGVIHIRRCKGYEQYRSCYEKEKKQRCFAQGLTVYRVDPHCRYHGRAVSLDAFHLAENAV